VKKTDSKTGITIRGIINILNNKLSAFSIFDII